MQVTAATALNHTQTRVERTQVPRILAPAALLLIGSASLSLYFWGRDLHRFTQWIAAYIGLFVGQLALYLLACFVVNRWSGKGSSAAKWLTIAMIIFFGAAYRAILVPQRPYLSSDVYRYAWDGQVQRSGINPYGYVPEATELSWLRDDKIFPNIAREDRNWTSPYPPVAQIVFLGVASGWPMSVTALKAAMASFDMLAIALLMLVLARTGLDPAKAIIFGWHPLVIFESAHSGHIEAVYVALLVAALLAWSHARSAWTGVALGLAAMMKFYPLLLLPAFLFLYPEAPNRSESNARATILSSSVARRLINKRNFAMLAALGVTIILVYLPYWNAGNNLFAFVRGYFEEEGFVNSGARYFFLELARRVFWIPTVAFMIMALVCLLVVVVRQLLREKRGASDVAQSSIALIGVYLLLTTPRYAWYYVWLIPFLCLARGMGWLYLTAASVLLYLLWYTPFVYPEIPVWLGASIYGPVLIWILWEKYVRRSEVKVTD
jgi:alpha-1,6-mannosyltransferase